jgi:hypothetical protein
MLFLRISVLVMALLSALLCVVPGGSALAPASAANNHVRAGTAAAAADATRHGGSAGAGIDNGSGGGGGGGDDGGDDDEEPINVPESALIHAIGSKGAAKVSRRAAKYLADVLRDTVAMSEETRGVPAMSGLEIMLNNFENDVVEWYDTVRSATDPQSRHILQGA